MPIESGAELIIPASVSNLGPAFDALAVAVELYMRVRVIAVRPATPDTLETEFVGQTPPGENRIEVAFRHARTRRRVSVPGLRIQVWSEIPVRAGLGSSAAATIAGLRLYEAATSADRGETISSRSRASSHTLEAGNAQHASDWLTMACEIEGHPDNAAAALLGGLTLSCQKDDRRVTARAWRWPPAIRFVVATPHVELETPFARSVLPAAVPLRDAVFNLQRALLLVRALETGRIDDLREAMRDRWHQPFRAPLVPGLAEALQLDHPSLLGVCLSGAGPSIVALTSAESDVEPLFRDVYQRLGVPYTIRTLAAHQPDASVASAFRLRAKRYGGPP